MLFQKFWVKRKKPFPKSIFWGRGNGWVICAFPMILDNIGLDHEEAPEIIELFRKTSEALLGCMREDGSFGTVEVVLDKRLPPSANAQVYYKKYNKSKKTTSDEVVFCTLIYAPQRNSCRRQFMAKPIHFMFEMN